MMIGSLEEAAHDAAIEDGVLSGYGAGRGDDLFKSKKAGLRRGKWTTEEEAYANRLIYEFKLGLLPLTDGTTLRTFLSKLLNCDPMRISKKFVGQNCIGKVNFKNYYSYIFIYVRKLISFWFFTHTHTASISSTTTGLGKVVYGTDRAESKGIIGARKTLFRTSCSNEPN